MDEIHFNQRVKDVRHGLKPILHNEGLIKPSPLPRQLPRGRGLSPNEQRRPFPGIQIGVISQAEKR